MTEPRVPLTYAMTLRDEQGIGRPGVTVRVAAAGPGGIDVHYEGPPVEQLVLTSMRGASPAPLRESPWPEDDVTASLEGAWRRQPNPTSDRFRGGSFPFGFELPGTTGGGEPPEPPPDRLRFTTRDLFGTPGLWLNGDPVVVVVGPGVVRVEQGQTDEWLIPVDADTLVPEYRTGNWGYPEVYRWE
ncbi:MAG: hypothetical protein Q8P18_27665 [Pseudomonadota bacterium]|nr:hypothetical protein [Pseudomonadota bacterium]